MTGKDPTGEIDHIDGVRDNNRWSNLRDVTTLINQENQKRAHKSNRTSGLMGVSWHSKKQKWRAGISHKNKSMHIGYFSDPNEAHAAYLSVKRRLHEGNTI